MRSKSKRFQKINLYTIIAVYFLILVGGIVRSTGAGMGCPDWPKCFGSYIPPTSGDGLPDNYEDFYVEKRLQKNERLASILNYIGLNTLSNRVLSDPNASTKTYFSVQKAWVEYLNRLVGVVIGLLIILNMLYSFLSNLLSVKILGILSFILVFFQGWIGSLVVSTNLLPGFISFHMGLALLLVCLLLFQRFKEVKSTSEIKGRWLITLILVLFGIQIIFGTQVREQIDQIHLLDFPKTSWVDRLDTLFYIHRSYSVFLTGLIGYFIYINWKSLSANYLILLLGLTVLMEILLGTIMTYFNFPSFAQPAHLFVGTVSFGVIFYLFLMSNYKSVKA